MPNFYTARYDRVFRTIFINDKDNHLLEALLSQCLKKEVKIIKLLKTELSVNSTKERVKRLDLLIETDGQKINLELNTTFNDATRVRNFNYFTSFYSSNTKIGEIYDYKTNFIHLDLSYGMGINKPVIDEYCVYSNKTNDVYINNFKIMVINIDKIMKFWYDNDEKKIKEYDLIIMLDLFPDDLKDLQQISNNKSIIGEYKGKVCKLNEDLDFVAPISAEEDYIMLMNTERQMAIEEGHELGRKQGIEQGRQEGIKQGIKQGIEQGTINEQLKLFNNLRKAKVTKNQILVYLNIDENEYNMLLKKVTNEN